ncbi:ScpA family protein [Limosilactobacillus sp.]|uniref:segregation and condensation protein A n=1 Tax=Limosilactobacillus sp. TaxID=2773925 RepID=UPI00345EE4CD
MSQEVINKYPYQPTLKLGDFEGPLDLLLHLIRENQMSITDIKIVPITSQYMSYLKTMREHRLEIAGDYFVMAATLMRIKSNLLLPKPPVEVDDTEEETDPREELIQSLLEYQRYKEAAGKLKDKENLRSREYTREAMTVPEGMVSAHVAPGVTLDQLKAAFADVLKRHVIEKPMAGTVKAERITVEDRIHSVHQQLEKGPARFVDLFADQASRENLVTTFLAILDMSKHGQVFISQAGLFKPLIVALVKKGGEQ